MLVANVSQAVEVDLEVWKHVRVEAPGTFAVGCPPSGCKPTTGAVWVGEPPWTFTVPSSPKPYQLIVTDGYDYGDIFEVFDFGSSIGKTSIVPPVPGGNCGNNPENCLLQANSSSGVFDLGIGAHSIPIQLFDEVGNLTTGGAFFFKATAVPLPAPLLLLGVGLFGLVRFSRRA